MFKAQVIVPLLVSVMILGSRFASADIDIQKLQKVSSSNPAEVREGLEYLRGLGRPMLPELAEIARGRTSSAKRSVALAFATFAKNAEFPKLDKSDEPNFWSHIAPTLLDLCSDLDADTRRIASIGLRSIEPTTIPLLAELAVPGTAPDRGRVLANTASKSVNLRALLLAMDGEEQATAYQKIQELRFNPLSEIQAIARSQKVTPQKLRVGAVRALAGFFKTNPALLADLVWLSSDPDNYIASIALFALEELRVRDQDEISRWIAGTTPDPFVDPSLKDEWVSRSKKAVAVWVNNHTSVAASTQVDFQKFLRWGLVTVDELTRIVEKDIFPPRQQIGSNEEFRKLIALTILQMELVTPKFKNVKPRILRALFIALLDPRDSVRERASLFLRGFTEELVPDVISFASTGNGSDDPYQTAARRNAVVQMREWIKSKRYPSSVLLELSKKLLSLTSDIVVGATAKEGVSEISEENRLPVIQELLLEKPELLAHFGPGILTELTKLSTWSQYVRPVIAALGDLSKKNIFDDETVVKKVIPLLRSLAKGDATREAVAEAIKGIPAKYRKRRLALLLAPENVRKPGTDAWYDEIKALGDVVLGDLLDNLKRETPLSELSLQILRRLVNDKFLTDPQIDLAVVPTLLHYCQRPGGKGKTLLRELLKESVPRLISLGWQMDLGSGFVIKVLHTLVELSVAGYLSEAQVENSVLPLLEKRAEFKTPNFGSVYNVAIAGFETLAGAGYAEAALCALRVLSKTAREIGPAAHIGAK